ncbi:MAG: diadenylate cyclase CdaA [Oscillospiraceae bacterium]|nr:diadenylate cyclase CdaA [Oscillospiraceae bacterium]MDD4414161.1 diadenylate cyclase CdaA [Oscillospiraceae bacterium]
MNEFLSTVWNNILVFLRSIDWFRDTLDIILVAFLIYSAIKLVRDSRAEQLLKGILIFILAFLAAMLLDLKTMYYLLKTVLNNSLIVLIIIFQPEIRRALEHMAHSRISPTNFFGMSDEETEKEIKRWQKSISAVCSALEGLQKQRMGALVVFERTTKLGEIINTGTILNAEATPELISNVFYNKAPLHDGAVVMRDGNIHAAGCILPLSDNPQISREIGTRHRAGVGMSENSDAIVVIVSEETGIISMAVGGVLKRNYTMEALRVALENGMLWDRSRRDKNGEVKTKKLFWRRKSK